jgi:PAS domain S-box-containing protein
LETFQRRSGYARDEIIGHTAVELELWGNPHQQDVLADTVKEKATSRDQEINLRTKSGQIVVTLQSVELIELDGRQCLLTVGQDITDRKRAAEELERLSGELLRLQDEERRKIARDLHDSTGQNLAGLAMMLGQLRDAIPLDKEKSTRLYRNVNC